MKILWALSALLFTLQAGAADDPAEWVKKADNIRNPAESYEMKIKVETSENTSVFQVYLKGQDKTLIVTKEPARDKGRNMLMLDRDFHAYVPNLKRSMRLSLAQKLSGQVANGDISRTRWYGDYSVELEKETGDEVQLFLKGKKDNLTYAAIRLWLKKGSYQPLRAEYLGLNGKTVLKRASFEDYKNISGAVRPTTLKIEDTNKQVSHIRILSMGKKDYPDSFFTVRNMESMK
ncbi:outer membrane lipoprotein-sorting protein [Bdellovibrio sp. 22V]|uniref:outer membrane lipoprotein-sorting protein n=1 Tax=Bdellovibrio TaxID=958 RepID=UPI0025435A3B|nr:outer membrane lipoprotein-sorting protein [Bdellovibrio sp. 22V]WII72858.1 outer membrane lipoprotein-sorting protein [Bdellovibrio sp. 22V]